MVGDLSGPTSTGEGLAVARASRPLLYLPPGVRLEEEAEPRPRGIRCGVERSKRAPKLWEKWCLELGGRNVYGKPVLRIVWSESQSVLVGGVWSKWDDSGNWLGERLGYQRTRKYPAVWERWVLEMWQPAEAFGGPDWWETKHRNLSPWGEAYLTLPIYPSRGDYLQIAVFQDPVTGGYSEPTWSDLPGLYGVQAKWREKDPLERFYELTEQLERQTRSAQSDVLEEAREIAGRTRAETFAELGIRTRVSLAGLEVPGRRKVA